MFRRICFLFGVLALAVAMAGPAAAMAPGQTGVVSQQTAANLPTITDGGVHAFAQIGQTIYVGGDFRSVVPAGGGSTTSRPNLLAFSAATGTLSTTFVPSIDGEVDALQPSADGSAIYVGGEFSTVNGTSTRYLTELSASSGQAVAGFTTPSLKGGVVKSLQLSGSTLWVAGSFTTVGKAPRAALVGLDAASGQFGSRANLTFTGTQHGGRVGVAKALLSPDGEHMVVIGNFTQVDGAPRAQIAVLDVGNTLTLADWQTSRYSPACGPAFNSYMRDVDFSPDGSYFVVVTTGGHHSGTLCDTAARWNTSTSGAGLQPDWVDVTGGDSLTAVAVSGAAVYVGGHERWFNNPLGTGTAGEGAVWRPGIGALDPSNGLPIAWNPTRIRGAGVYAFLLTATGLYEGSNTSRVSHADRGRVAFFPLAGGTAAPVSDAGSLPGDVYSGSSSSLTWRSYDGTSLGPATPSAVEVPELRGAHGMFFLDGHLYYGGSDGNFYSVAFNGTSVGSPEIIDGADQIVPISQWHAQIPDVTSMFFSDGRLYYTVAGMTKLYSRAFTADGGVVGQSATTSSSVRGVYWAKVTGGFVCGSTLYFTEDDGTLRAIDFVSGKPIAGTARTFSGPSIDGIDWSSGGLFMLAR